jgi:hypothetical protein
MDQLRLFTLKYDLLKMSLVVKHNNTLIELLLLL